MSSQDPPEDEGKRSMRQAIRSGFARAKDAFKRPLSPRPPPGSSGHLTPLGSGHQIQSSFGRSPPRLTTGPATESNRQAITLPSEPSSVQPSTLNSQIDTSREHKKSDSPAWNRLKSSLRVLESCVDLFPPLKSAVGAFIGCLDLVQTAASNRTDYEELTEELQYMADVLNEYASELESESRNGSIANIARSIETQVASITQHEKSGTIGRLLDATQDQEDIIRRYRQVEKLFRQMQTTLLRGMSPVDDSRYNSGYSMIIKRRGCTAETREAIHQALKDWTTSPKSEKIYWMNGMAGTGKTTIAYSYCEWLESTHRLGASFFCSRISSTCRSLIRIVPTIAYQLARYSPAFRSKLCAELKANPDAGTLNVMQQFEKLINEPMLNCKNAIPDSVVVVIDALDECDDNYSVRLLLDVLLKFADRLPLKFFVASRPEHAIRDRMVSQGGAARAIVHLHDIEHSIVEEDIKKYLTESFHSMLPPPSQDQIATLARRARNLFIYAATVVRYIHPEAVHVDSSKRLKLMLAAISDSQAISKNKYEDLDRLYTTVLTAVFNAPLDDDERGCMQRVLWTVVCAKEPMTVATISSLASLEESQVWVALQSLRSVVHVPENDTLISTLHASFPEYMLNESRSGDFYCNEAKSNKRLVYRFFDVMKSELRFNICNLESSYLCDDQVEDLVTRVAQRISPTLLYACRYWSSHLLLSPTLASTSEKVIDFLSNRFLFWMEVLSLNRCIGIGAPMMQQVETWLRRLVDTPDEIRKQVSDARNFVTWFAANPCSRSTPHIYISALPLCAKTNWVYQHYSQRIKGLANIAISQRDESVLAIWSPGSSVFSVVISPNDTTIAAEVKDGSIQIYDIHTGASIMEPFRGHTRNVWSVVFSLDGTLIASGSEDKTVIIWDAQTGRIATGPLRGHKREVCSVAFSPDGDQVVSGSWDQTAIVWNTQSGDIIFGPLKGHGGSIKTVAFSPDGQLIASGSNDQTIRLWDTKTGVAVNKPFEGHEGYIWMVAFSPDGSKVASCSDDKTVRVWDAQTGAPVCPPFEGHTGGVRSLAFSPDGTLLASGGLDDYPTIIVWDTRTSSKVVGPLHGHKAAIESVQFLAGSTQLISCSEYETIRIWDVQTTRTTPGESTTRELPVGPVAFSPDCTQLISSSTSGTLQLWDMHKGAPISSSLEGQTNLESIESVAFSPQGTHIAASANDCTIRVWNIQTGAAIPQPLIGHKRSVGCLAFSPNGSHICSGSDDSTITIWDIQTGAIIGRPYEGHTGSVHSVAFSPDGTHIISGAADCTVRIWDPVTGIPAQTLSGHNGSVKSVALSFDGRYIVSGSSDQTIRKWDVQGASDPVEYRCSNPVQSVAFSPDGTRFIAGFGSTIQIISTQVEGAIWELSLPEKEMVSWVGFSPDGTNIISTSIPKDLDSDPGSDSGSSVSEPESYRTAEETTQQPLQSPNIIRVWRANSDDAKTDTSTTSGDWSYERDGRTQQNPRGFASAREHHMVLRRLADTRGAPHGH